MPGRWQVYLQPCCKTGQIMTQAHPSATVRDTPPDGSSALLLPAHWRAQLDTQLAGDERILAWLEIDLDARLHFSSGVLVVTSERLLSAEGKCWTSWTFRPGLSLSRRDHSGVGTLELTDADHLLAHWRYTLGADVAAGRLVDHFTRQLA